MSLKAEIETSKESIRSLTAALQEEKKRIQQLTLQEAREKPPPPFSSRMVMQIHEFETHHASGIIIGECHFTTPSRACHSAKLDLTAFLKASGFEITPLFSAFLIDFTVKPILRQNILKTLKEEEL